MSCRFKSPTLNPQISPLAPLPPGDSNMVAEISDMSDKESECEDSLQVTVKKLCVDCGTSKTPLWRSGPAGPKSLCNACGVKRNRHKRRALLETNKSNGKKEEPRKKMKCRDSNGSDNSCINSSSSNGSSNSSTSKDRLLAMWDALNPQNVKIEDLNEEHQAALLLLALSHQFNYL